jgi:diguanylate cyclase (GGDEF)-like protein/PAS domain S-box-containing protein
MNFLKAFQGFGLRARGGGRRARAARPHNAGAAGLPANPSLTRRLALLAVVIAVQALVSTASLHTLSFLRVFIEGESNWSKSQQNAFNDLEQYLDLGDEQDYQRFRAAIAKDFEYNHGRQALEKPRPDRAAATAHFLKAGVHPDDIAGAIFILIHFNDYSHFREATAIWRASDAMLDELVALGETIHARIARGERPADDVALQTRISEFDAAFQTMATSFSKALAAGTRDVATQLTFVNIGVALTLMGLVAWRIRALFRRSQSFENALRSEKEQAQVTLQSIADGVIRIDARACVEYINPAAERLIGMGQAEARGRPIATLVAIVDETSNTACDRYIDALLEGDPRFGPDSELSLVTAAGSTPVSVRGEAFKAEDGTRGAVLVLRDMTRERDLIARLSWQATHDELTGLPNRRELDRRLRLRKTSPDAGAGEDALLLLDLDQFKLVNDTCGHAAGDELLREVAELLKLELGETGLPLRLGGDEFAVLMPGCGVAQAKDVAERLRVAIEDLAFTWAGRLFKISASIGLVPHVGEASNAQDVFRAADVACYMAKDKGRNRVELHETGDVEILKHVSEMGWVHRINDALDEDRLCLHAQRIAPLQRGGDDDGHFELLVRMRDEKGRIVPPGSFIPAAERYGLINRVDRWIVNAAFATLAEAYACGQRVSCAINLSGQSLGDPSFIAFVRAQFDLHGVAPSAVSFEITETTAIANLEEAAKFIRTFREIGCKFALDDFGAGMSSFGYLKRLPVDYLKIDGGFVKDMLVDPGDRAMVDMIARMARTLGVKTIAEFAETQAIVEDLRTLGVDYAQGYAIGRPAPLCEHLHCAHPRCGAALRARNRALTVPRCA